MERNTDVFQFQGSKMIVSGKGPNTNFFNKPFTLDRSVRPMNWPRNFENRSSATSVASSQQSYRRGTSPTASVYSDLQSRNFHQPFYSRGFSQRSVYNDRAVSPVSIRSIDSTVSRADTIKSCIDTIKCCTEDELKMIKHAVYRNLEYKKKAKRRKMQKCLNNFHNRYEDDDSEQGSSSSISNDDRVSTRTGCSWKQRNGLLQNEKILYSQNNTMCGPRNTFFSQRYTSGQANISSMQRNTLNASIYSTKSMQNMTMMSQRDRIRGGFQFPSQRFNRSILFEEQQQVRCKQVPNTDCANKKMAVQRNLIDELSDDNDNIFLDTTEKQKTVAKKSEKRKVENLGYIPNPPTKKPKTCSSTDKVKKLTQIIDNNENNEFEFVKPQFPVKKLAPAKPREIMISKSSGIPDLLCSTQENEIPKPQPVRAPSSEPRVEPEQDDPDLTTSDMSMRPSFMKRKLFTQTLDVTERKNNSFNSGTADSPQSNIYSALSREKHKTRKLVTSQSLLSRDVNQDDDNLLDLIHKIVPPNQVNSTITANNTKPRVSGTKNGDDKWDITSIISTCNNGSMSETYTDDEIFSVSINDTKSKPKQNPVSKQNKQEGKHNVANKPETKKAENNTTPINDKNIKDVGNTNSKQSRNVGHTKLQSDRNVKSHSNANQINSKNTKDVTNIKTTKNNIKIIEESKLANNKIVKELDDIKLVNNKNAKGAPVKPCPTTRVMLGGGRVDDFWDTDDSDHECARRRLSPAPVHHHTDLTLNHGINPKQSGLNTQPPPSTKETKINKTPAINPLVVLQDVLNIQKKQESKNKTQSKPKKKSDDNSQPEKRAKHNIVTPNTSLRPRRLRNRSAMQESANSSEFKKSGNDSSLKENIPTKTKIQKKETAVKKGTQDNKNKTNATEITKNLNKKEQNSLINNSTKLKETSKSQCKTSKVQIPADQINIDNSKVLRSRNIDLSSSFNSDKFVITATRTRKSRTPSKRISFNKSKNVLPNNKIRSRAVKS